MKLNNIFKYSSQTLYSWDLFIVFRLRHVSVAAIVALLRAFTGCLTVARLGQPSFAVQVLLMWRLDKKSWFQYHTHSRSIGKESTRHDGKIANASIRTSHIRRYLHANRGVVRRVHASRLQTHLARYTRSPPMVG